MRDLKRLMQDVGFKDITIDTRIVILTPNLAAAYFTETGKTAQTAGVITAAEFARWASANEDLRQRGRLFCSIGYYLFSAQV